MPPKRGAKKKAPAKQLSAEEHFENAEMAFAMESFDKARASFKRALDMEPENLEYLEGYGSFLAEVGDQAEAVAVLRRAVALQPEEGFEKYMYLGQLSEGAEAEAAVRKGISILRAYIAKQEQELAAAEGGEDAAEQAATRHHLDNTLASCLCSLAEVLMNQAQGSEAGVSDVEAAVEEALREARGLAPVSPEPLQALASLRQQQGGRDEEALALLRQSVALWFRPTPDDDESDSGEDGDEKEEGGEGAVVTATAAAAPAAAAPSKKGGKKPSAEEPSDDEGELGSEEASSMDDDDSDDDDDQPSYEFRFEAAKLLLELDDNVETASMVLEQLLEENDEDPNVWLLMALCCQGGGDLEGALEAAEDGLALCKKLRLPAGHELVAGFEAMQGELQQLLKDGGGGDDEDAAVEEPS